jgi:hypothetical protein
MSLQVIFSGSEADIKKLVALSSQKSDFLTYIGNFMYVEVKNKREYFDCH